MASWGPYRQKTNDWEGFRVRYVLWIGGQKKSKAKYPRTEQAAKAMTTSATHLERSCRERQARNEEIRRWIIDELLTEGEAAQCFPGWADTQDRIPEKLKGVDFDAILAAYEERILAASKAQDPHRKTHRNHMSTARQVLTWLREKHPALTSLDEEGCRKRYAELRSKYSEWTACHHMTKMRHLPWHAFIQFIRYFTSIATILPAWVSKAPSITLLCSRHTRVRSRSSFCCQRVSNTRSS